MGEDYPPGMSFASETRYNSLSPTTPSSVSTLMSDMSLSTSTSSSNAILKDERYYITSGDIVFKVESTLFRVHRYFFQRECALFGDMIDGAVACEGRHDHDPFHLQDITALDFSRFLWVFYNPDFCYDNGVAEWTSILRLAHQWNFPKVKELAIRQLDKHDIGPIERIVLARDYGVKRDWSLKALAALGNRQSPLTMEEGSQLGMEIVIKVAALRERIRERRHNDNQKVIPEALPTSSPSRSPCLPKTEKSYSRSPSPEEAVRSPPSPLFTLRRSRSRSPSLQNTGGKEPEEDLYELRIRSPSPTRRSWESGRGSPQPHGLMGDSDQYKIVHNAECIEVPEIKADLPNFEPNFGLREYLALDRRRSPSEARSSVAVAHRARSRSIERYDYVISSEVSEKEEILRSRSTSRSRGSRFVRQQSPRPRSYRCPSIVASNVSSKCPSPSPVWIKDDSRPPSIVRDEGFDECPVSPPSPVQLSTPLDYTKRDSYPFVTENKYGIDRPDNFSDEDYTDVRAVFAMSTLI